MEKVNRLNFCLKNLFQEKQHWTLITFIFDVAFTFLAVVQSFNAQSSKSWIFKESRFHKDFKTCKICFEHPFLTWDIATWSESVLKATVELKIRIACTFPALAQPFLGQFSKSWWLMKTRDQEDSKMVLFGFLDPIIVELQASKVKLSFFWDTRYFHSKIFHS